MELVKQKAFLIKIIFWAAVVALGIATIKIGGALLFPFIVGFLIAFLLKPPISFICKKTRANRKLISIALLVLVYLILIWIVIAAGDEIISDISQLVNNIPQIYKVEIEPLLNIVVEKIRMVLVDTFGSFQLNLSDLPSRIASIVTFASGNILKITTGAAAKVPSFLLNMLLIIISSFFFTLDYHRITAFILRQFSPKKQELIVAVKTNIVTTVGNLLKAYGIIILWTAVELFVGLSMLNVQGAGLLAVLIAFIDILPVLGTGTILIPWSVIELILGNQGQAIGLLILWAVILVIRQILEPKIVGKQVGVHPILILISIYVGIKLFGAIGIFLLPILLTVVKNLNDKGIIRIFK